MIEERSQTAFVPFFLLTIEFLNEYCLLRLKLNRLLLECRGCSYKLDFPPNSAIFKFLIFAQRAGSSRLLGSPAKCMVVGQGLRPL